MILSRCDLGSRASDSMFDTSSDNRHPYRWTAFNAHVLIDGNGFAPTPVQQFLNGQDLSRLGLTVLHNLDESLNRGLSVLASDCRCCRPRMTFWFLPSSPVIASAPPAKNTPK